MEITTKSAKETKDFGRKVGFSLNGGEILLLSGNLGAGKTTFVQGLAEGMGLKVRIISPTFVLMKQYKNLYHIDLYRLEKNVGRELLNLGVEEIWNDENNVVVIEWAEKVKGVYPTRARWIKFETLDQDTRKIKKEGYEIIY